MEIFKELETKYWCKVCGDFSTSSDCHPECLAEEYSGDVLPFLIPVGVNVFANANDEYYLWLVIDDPFYGAESYGDIEQGDDVGREPEWLDDEIINIGWYYLLDIKYGEEGWVEFMLKHGIAPGQPFLIKIIPELCKGGFEDYDELDLLIDIVKLAPCENPLKAWEDSLKDWDGFVKEINNGRN